jgi:hypothetical protein
MNRAQNEAALAKNGFSPANRGDGELKKDKPGETKHRQKCRTRIGMREVDELTPVTFD